MSIVTELPREVTQETPQRPAAGPPASTAPASASLLDTRRAWLTVLAIAVLSRFLMAGEWSLWRDEERSIYFAEHTGRAFASSFPVFFLVLRAVFEATGVSVFAARSLTATLGVLSIVLTYAIASRLIRREVGVLAAAFLTLSVGHLFWSQSIRYYILLLVFQLASVYFFLSGLERGRLRHLVAANAFLALAALTHLSAALLFPVFVAHVALSLAAGDRGGGYGWKGYATFAAPFAVASVLLLTQYSAFSAVLSNIIAPRAGEPLLSPYLVYKIVAYFGGPAVLLGLAAPVLGAGVVPPRALRFFSCLAMVPIAELMATTRLGIAFPLWYQALVAGVGFAVLAAISLYALRARGYLTTYRVALAGAVVASLPLLVAYYTTMHGDRPRWKDAAQFIQAHAAGDGGASTWTIYSTNPEALEFYLAGEALPQAPRVRHLEKPFTGRFSGEVVFAVENDETTIPYQRFLRSRTVLLAQFEAWTGPKNRTVSVFRYSAPPADERHASTAP